MTQPHRHAETMEDLIHAAYETEVDPTTGTTRVIRTIATRSLTQVERTTRAIFEQPLNHTNMLHAHSKTDFFYLYEDTAALTTLTQLIDHVIQANRRRSR